MSLSGASFGKELLETINSKDVQKSLTQVQQYREKMKDNTVGADFVNWISEPVNLTSVHKALAEDLGVPPRAMIIKRVAMSRTQRAMLLVQAMEGAIKRVHKL
ncbi:MAG TPA: hypothetical protein VIY47_15125 [Ignavibacteriaceae bacterium]